MPAVLGFCSFSENREIKEFFQKSKCEDVLLKMKKELIHRKPVFEYATCEHAALNGYEINGYLISFSGLIYNKEELEPGKSNEEIVINIVIKYGIEGIGRINGAFAGAIYDIKEEKLFLFRDHIGIAPLFYTFVNDMLVFSSEIRGLFKFPDFKPVLDKEGLMRLFALGPAVEEGSGILRGVNAVLSGNILIIDRDGIKNSQYWSLESKLHNESFDDTAEHIMYLLKDSIVRQMKSPGNTKICSFLSGGIDSCIVTAIMANEMKKSGKRLDTFSFDFEGNDKYFVSNDFQPERDRPYVDKMVELFRTNHCYMECGNASLSGYLSRALEARGLPGMADIDSSLMFFCDAVKQTNDIALTGECSDEIFAGYPWFHKAELYEADLFPWSKDIDARKLLLKDEFLETVDLEGFAKERYNKTISDTPYLDGESDSERRKRELSYLTIKWFMPTLGDRTERMGALSGLSARMPFSDKRLIEYVWNIPYEMKTRDGIVKGLLRESAKGLLSDELLYRKKSPYPKTYNPAYTEILSFKLKEILEDSYSPICRFADMDKAKQLMSAPMNYGRPWFGQLMAGPQMLAYFIQINTWIEKNNISIEI